MANDYYKKGEEEYAKQEKSANETAQKKKDEITAQVGEANALAERNTQEQIEDTTDEYLDIVRSAGIQKELDLRDIRETRANMGLSRSGLSATEQTAATLSAGNKVGNAQIARQTAIDTLNQSLIDYKNENAAWERQQHLAIDAAKDESLSKIRTDIFDAATTATSNDYQAGVKAQSDATVAQINANKTLEKDRVSGLNSAWKDGKFGTYNNEVYVIANNARWSVAEALRYAPYIESIKNNGGIEKYFTNSRGERNKYIDKTTTGIGDYIAQIPGISYEGIAAMADYFGVDISS